MILSKLNPIAPFLIEFNQPFAKVAVIRKNKTKGDKNRKKKMKKKKSGPTCRECEVLCPLNK